MTGFDPWEDEDLIEEPGPPPPEAPAAETAPPLFSSVYEFVEDQLSPMYARTWKRAGKQRIWCPQWWAHAEAVSRLEAVWRAYECLRLDPTTGMSVWWRDHLDPHMAVLCDPDGPFAGCSSDSGHDPSTGPIPVDPMPDVAVRVAMSVQQ